ncbi:PAAR domain-containing protein [Acidiphilium rubrum]|uniref:PAAR domain-containing protein n=2 Tax=Acidocellaceae TaxID=3385905 RepID=UPI001FE16451|nr:MULTISPECIES: PAAR domain-containing protein [Acidiphilium]
MHTCPETTGPVPHIGGPILTGSPNVLIGGLAAARVTDKVTCVGPPDAIVMGSPTVLINGLMAARMGDQTAHGGMIVGGLGTVLIGMGGAGPSAGDLGAAGAGPATPSTCLVKAAQSGAPFIRQGG